MVKTASGELFRRWSLYESIILENWMQHREVSSAIQRVLAQRSEPVRVLDLGCGDGWMARQCLSANHVFQYVGVDLSQAALGIILSSGGLGTHSQHMELELRCEDMTSVASRLAGQTFDIVLASYAIHHLTSEAKRDLLGHISRLLKPQASFMWTDLACQPDESPQAYLQRLTQHIDTHWTSLPPEERVSAIDHINRCDYPEQPTWMSAHAAANGLSMTACLYQDDFFGCWQFVKVA